MLQTITGEDETISFEDVLNGACVHRFPCFVALIGRPNPGPWHYTFARDWDLADPFESPQEPTFKLHDLMEIKLDMHKL